MCSDYKFKKGDKVRVWSLQSFSGGGFLNGAEAVVRQSQMGESVILAVFRNIGGEQKLDTSYEVYAKQCELIIESTYISEKERLERFREELLKNKAIS